MLEYISLKNKSVMTKKFVFSRFLKWQDEAGNQVTLWIFFLALISFLLFIAVLYIANEKHNFINGINEEIAVVKQASASLHRDLLIQLLEQQVDTRQTSPFMGCPQLESYFLLLGSQFNREQKKYIDDIQNELKQLISEHTSGAILATEELLYVIANLDLILARLNTTIVDYLFAFKIDKKKFYGTIQAVLLAFFLPTLLALLFFLYFQGKVNKIIRIIFNDTLKQASVGLAYVDDQGKILLANSAFWQILDVKHRLQQEHVCHLFEDDALCSKFQETLQTMRDAPDLASATLSFCHRCNLFKQRHMELRLSRLSSASKLPFLYLVWLTDSSETMQAKQDAEIADKRFRVLFENTLAISVQGYDASRCVMFWNRASEELYGYTQPDVLGARIEDLIIPDESRQQMLAQIQHMIRTKTSSPASELRLKHADGSYVDVFSNHIVLDIPGRDVEFYCLDINISEQKRIDRELEEHRNRLREMVDERTRQLKTALQEVDRTKTLLHEALSCISQGFVIYDPDNCIYLFNATYLEYYKISAEVICKGARFEDILRWGVWRGQYQDAIGREEAWIGEHIARHQRADGEVTEHLLGDGRWILTMKVRTPSGYIVSNRIDITEQKRTQQMLAQARDEANAANRAKSLFLANMSHEIRTPINAIMGCTHLALRNVENAKQRELLDSIDAASEHLLGIINNILDLSKIEAGKLELRETEFDLERVVYNVCRLILGKARSKGLEIILDIDPSLYQVLLRGDALRLSQALLNYVVNAVNFTDTGYILLSVVKISEDATSLGIRFEVEDTGAGIAIEKQAMIFEPFVQADNSTTRRHGGTGLGLAINRQLVKLMEGEIGMDSTLGHGSKFWFTLKLSKDTKRVRKLPKHTELPTANILLLETSRRVTEILMRVLHLCFDCVDSTDNADAGLAMMEKYARQGSSVIVLVDWKLAQRRGFIETLRSIRLRVDVPHRCDLMLMAYTDEYIPDEILCETAAVLSKPFGPSALYAFLSSFAAGTLKRQNPAFRTPVYRIEDLVRKHCPDARILLAEDNPLNQRVASEMLQDAGLCVDIAPDGKTAINMLEKQHYDLVLMDVQMPIMDGIRATRVLRSSEQFRDLPILAMTASTFDEDVSSCLEAGMNDHLGKPIRAHQLFNKLLQWLCPDGLMQHPHTLPYCGEVLEKASIPDNGQGFSTDIASYLLRNTWIDAQTAMKLSGGELEKYMEFLTMFHDIHGQDVKKLKTALDGNDREQLASLSHALCGSSLMLGIQNIAEHARQLGQLNKETVLPTEGIAEIIEKISQDFECIKKDF